MDQFNLFSFFGEEAVKGEETLLNAAESKDIKGTKKASRKADKENPSLDGPVSFIGRGFEKTVGELGTKKTLSEWLMELFHAGIKEAAMEDCKCILSNQCVYLTTPNTPSKEDTAIMAEEVAIVDGELQTIFKLEDFPSMEKDEISIMDVLDKLENTAQTAFHKISICYDVKAKIGMPIYDTLNDKKISLPIDVLMFGDISHFTMNDFLGKAEIELSELDDLLYSGNELSISYQKRQDGVIIPVFKAAKGVKTLSPDRTCLQTDEKATAKIAVEKYALPATIYLVQYGTSIPVTSEHFCGKSKVGKEEILDFLKTDFSIFRSSERKTDIIYNSSSGIISVAAISGTKGYRRHRFAGRKGHTENTGLFKLIRSEEEFTRVCKEEYYFGNYVESEKVTRLENLPIGVFTCQYGYKFSVKGVGFKPKLSKVPAAIMDETLTYFKQDLSKEAIVQIWYDRKQKTFEVKYPKYSVSTKERIDYEFEGFEHQKVLYMTIHSHNTFEARFSVIDDEDEIATGLYGVIGTLDKEATFRFRAGIAGHFTELPMQMLFETYSEWEKLM